MEERYVRVTYHFLGAAVGWLVAIVMMAMATWHDSWALALWALMVVAAAAVGSFWAVLIRSRAVLMESIDLRLRMQEQVQVNGVPRIPTPR